MGHLVDAVGFDREKLGQLVRQIWVEYCLETGDTKPSHIAPWDELSEWDKEVDRRIGMAVAEEALGIILMRAIEQQMPLRKSASDAMHAWIRKYPQFEWIGGHIEGADLVDEIQGAITHAVNAAKRETPQALETVECKSV